MSFSLYIAFISCFLLNLYITQLTNQRVLELNSVAWPEFSHKEAKRRGLFILGATWVECWVIQKERKKGKKYQHWGMHRQGEEKQHSWERRRALLRESVMWVPELCSPAWAERCFKSNPAQRDMSRLHCLFIWSFLETWPRENELRKLTTVSKFTF